MGTRRTRGNSEAGMSFTLAHYSQTQSQQNKDGEDVTKQLFFVIPENQTPKTCSKSLQNAYELCQKFELHAEWLSAKDLFMNKPKPGNVFVCDPFGGRAYDFLYQCFIDSKAAKKFMIIGPMCLEYVINRNELSAAIATRGFPFYTMAMKDVFVTLSGFTPEEQEELTDLIQKMNGLVSKPLNASTTHVVTAHTLTPKCKEAFRRTIPVMSAEWVKITWDESKKALVHATDSKYKKYRCKLFHNVKICLSQVQTNQKLKLTKLITEAGGVVSKDFKKHETQILVVPTATGEKHKHALLWHLPPVIPSWIEDSVEAGYLLPVEDYKPELPGASNRDRIMSSTQIDGAVGMLPLQTSIIGTDQTIGGSESVVVATTFDNMTVMSTVEGVSEPTDSRIQRDPMEILKAAQKGFLDQLKIYVCEVKHSRKQKPPVVMDELRQLINDSGAHCFLSLNSSVTHIIVVEGQISDQEKATIAKMKKRPFILPFQWLVECAVQNRIVEEDGFCLSDVIPEQEQRLSDSSADHVSQPKRSSNDNIQGGSNKRLNGSVFQEPDRVKESDVTERTLTENADAEPPMAVRKILFEKLTFKVRLENEEETAKAEKVIHDEGGNISRKSDAGKTQVDIMITTPVYDPTTVHTAQVYTKYWLNDVIESNTLEVPVEVYHKALPLSHGMEDLLEGVVLAISAYPDVVKEYLRSVAAAMGATVQEVFAKKTSSSVFRTTHLICGSTENAKYQASKRWGTPAVTMDWVVECCKRQEKLDVGDFSLENTDYADTTTVYALTPNSQGKREARLGKQPEKQISDGVFKTPQNVAPQGSSSATPGTDATKTEEESPLISPYSRATSRYLKEMLENGDKTPTYIKNRQLPKRRPSTPFSEILKITTEMCLKGMGIGPEVTPSHENDNLTGASPKTAITNPKERASNGSVERRNSETSETSRKRSQSHSSEEGDYKVISKRMKSSSESSEGSGQNERDGEVNACEDTVNRSRAHSRDNRSKFNSFEDIGEPEHGTENNPDAAGVYWEDGEPEGEQSEVGDNNEGELPSHVSENAEENCSASVVIPTHFGVSGAPTSDKEHVKQCLELLGGSLSSQDNFDEACDAIIAYKITRSEKILCAIASGKPLLHNSYVDACVDDGKLLPVDKYLWKEELGSTDAEKNLARVANVWYDRIKQNPTAKPYNDLVVWVCEQKKARREAYVRLIEAGGGAIATSPEDANVVLGDGPDAASIGDRKSIPVKLPMYLNNVILLLEE